MIALYDHIQQLRAELAGCLDPEERSIIAQELAEAAKLHHILECELGAEIATVLRPPT